MNIQNIIIGIIVIIAVIYLVRKVYLTSTGKSGCGSCKSGGCGGGCHPNEEAQGRNDLLK